MIVAGYNDDLKCVNVNELKSIAYESPLKFEQFIMNLKLTDVGLISKIAMWLWLDLINDQTSKKHEANLDCYQNKIM